MFFFHLKIPTDNVKTKALVSAQIQNELKSEDPGLNKLFACGVVFPSEKDHSGHVIGEVNLTTHIFTIYCYG